MRAALIATALAASAAPLPATAAEPSPDRADAHAATHASRYAAESPSTHNAAQDSALIAYAVELNQSESRSQEKEQYLATTNLRAALFEISRHPRPSNEECAHTLGASRFAEQYAELAALHDKLGEFEAVIEANESALACQPRVVTYEASIASAQLSLGHVDEARAAIERGHAIDPEDPRVRSVRADLDFIQERWADATARFRLQVLDEQFSPQVREYARCYLWLAQRRAGVRNPELPQLPDDPKELKDQQAPPPREWPAKMLDTLRGQMNEEALVQVIREDGVSDARGWLTEALFYVGELKLAEGDTEAARRYFASVINLKALDYVEYGMARAELKKIRERGTVADAATAGAEAR